MRKHGNRHRNTSARVLAFGLSLVMTACVIIGDFAVANASDSIPEQVLEVPAVSVEEVPAAAIPAADTQDVKLEVVADQPAADQAAAAEAPEAAVPDAAGAVQDADQAAAEAVQEIPVIAQMPAVDFEPVTVNNVRVIASAPEGAFPAGVKMQVLPVASGDVVGELNQASAAPLSDGDVVAFNITFYVNDPSEDLQPTVPISVKFENVPLSGEALEVYHMKDADSQASKVAETENDGTAEVKDATDFSIYALVSTQWIQLVKASRTLQPGAAINIYSDQTGTDDSFTSSDTAVASVVKTTGTKTNAAYAKITAGTRTGTATITHTWIADGKTNAETCTIHVIGSSTGKDVYFYLLLPEKEVPKNSNQQANVNYAPNDKLDGGHYAWKGTAVPLADAAAADKDGNQFIYDASGQTAAQYILTAPVDQINAYLLKKYGTDAQAGTAKYTYDNVVWYTYKNAITEFHFDGYLKDFDYTQVVYHSNYDQDVTDTDDKLRTGDYTVKTYDSTGLPVRTGYTFMGWSEKADSKTADAAYTPGGQTTLMNALQLFAVWKANTTVASYGMAYYLEQPDGSYLVDTTASEDSITANIGSEVTIPEKDYTVKGYTFDKENTDNVLTGKVAADNQLVLKRYYKLAKYTVTYEPGTQGTFTAQITTDLTFGKDTPAAPTGAETGKTGYQFAGWQDDQGNTYALTTDLPKTVTRDVTYTALWNTVPVNPGTDTTTTTTTTTNTTTTTTTNDTAAQTGAVLGAKRGLEATVAQTPVLEQEAGAVLGASRSPKTSDESRAILWALVMGASGIGAAALLAGKKREKH